jgi:hypothetical protein
VLLRGAIPEMNTNGRARLQPCRNQPKTMGLLAPKVADARFCPPSRSPHSGLVDIPTLIEYNKLYIRYWRILGLWSGPGGQATRPAAGITEEDNGNGNGKAGHLW